MYLLRLFFLYFYRTAEKLRTDADETMTRFPQQTTHLNEATEDTNGFLLNGAGEGI